VGRDRLYVVAARGQAGLIGVVALAARLGTLVSLANWHTPEFAPLVDPAAAQLFADALLSLRPAALSLAFLDPARAGTGVWRDAAAAAGYRFLQRPLERPPYIAVDGDWERYKAGRDGALLRELRRRRRLLEAEGPVWLEVADGRGRLEELLDEGLQVEAAGWKGSVGSAILSRDSTRCFYRELGRWAAELGWLRLAFLRLGRRALAFDFAIEHGGVHYLLKTGYDPAFARYGPGVLLRYEMIKRAFAEGLSRYDFLGADEPWKLEWTDLRGERVVAQAFAPSLRGRLTGAAFARLAPLVRRARRAVAVR